MEEETAIATATATQIINFHEYENDEKIHEPILKLLSENAYDMTYVSFGSKYNEDIIELPYTDITIYSNSMYQIIPGFIRAYEKILVICIDYFNDEEIDFHKTEIDKIIKESDVKQIDFIFIKNIVGKITVKSEIGKIIMKNRANIKKLLESIILLDNINEENFMCVNYIKFKGPNVIETHINEVYDKLFFDLNEIKNVFYIWFGYNIYFYNLILKANKILYTQLTISINNPKTKKIITDFNASYTQLNLSDIKEISQSNPSIDYFKRLYNNCMDIRYHMTDDNKMNKIQIEGGKRKTKKRTKKLYKRSERKYKKCKRKI